MKLLYPFLAVFAIASNMSSASPAIASPKAPLTETSLRDITEAEAIKIAARYVKEKSPDLDITLRPPVAAFFPRGFTRNGKEFDAWAVNFGIAAPAGYSRSIISHSVWIDRYGRILAGPMTTSP